MKNKSDSEKLDILVVGGGAREHALVWKLAQSPRAGQIYAAPGNPGMSGLAQLVPLAADDLDSLCALAREKAVDLAVIGPEAPLALGLADRLEAQGVSSFGPKAGAARLESSKPFAKDFMARHKIPTAACEVFNDSADALEYLAGKPDGPIVVKAAGLAQGKGVTVAAGRAEAEAAVREAMLEGRFGEAGKEIVIEDFIDGEEVTILAFTDGRELLTMPPVQDHKRLGEGDTGPNTGGMGAYSPVAVYTPFIAEQAERSIFRPTLEGLRADGLDYRGCLYFGLILPHPGGVYQGPQVIEYNCRFGDPETEALMPLLDSDLVEIMLGCARGDLGRDQIAWREETAVCVVMASGGYPGPYKTGLTIIETIPSHTESSLAFHAGTALNENGETVTAGGRVLTVAAKDKSLEGALKKAYDRVRAIHFKDSCYRRDIAFRELDRRK